MTEQLFRPEPHQKLIDGLTALVLADQLDKAEALQIIAYYNEKHPEASWLDEAVLFQLKANLNRPAPKKYPPMQSFTDWINRLVEIGETS